MAETQTLRATDKARIERRLERLHQRLVRELEGLEQSVFAHGGGFDRQADEGVEAQAQDLDIDLIECNGTTLREVAVALERLREGEYGSCEDCGTAIAEERLELLPHARRCTPCAVAEERARLAR